MQQLHAAIVTLVDADSCMVSSGLHHQRSSGLGHLYSGRGPNLSDNAGLDNPCSSAGASLKPKSLADFTTADKHA